MAGQTLDELVIGHLNWKNIGGALEKNPYDHRAFQALATGIEGIYQREGREPIPGLEQLTNPAVVGKYIEEGQKYSDKQLVNYVGENEDEVIGKYVRKLGDKEGSLQAIAQQVPVVEGLPSYEKVSELHREFSEALELAKGDNPQAVASYVQGYLGEEIERDDDMSGFAEADLLLASISSQFMANVFGVVLRTKQLELGKAIKGKERDYIKAVLDKSEDSAREKFYIEAAVMGSNVLDKLQAQAREEANEQPEMRMAA